MNNNFSEILNNKVAVERKFDRPDYVFHSNYDAEPLCIMSEGKGPRHYITKSGMSYPSITTLLKETMSESKKKTLDAWRKRVGDEAADKRTKDGADRGTNLHNLVEKFLLGKDNFNTEFTLASPHTQKIFTQIYPHLKKINNIRCLETPLYSDGLLMAGKVDLIAEYNGELSVIDFKTSFKAKEEYMIEDYFIQTCAYSLMYAENFKEKIKKNVIIMSVDDAPFADVFIKPPMNFIPKLIEKKKIYYRNKFVEDQIPF